MGSGAEKFALIVLYKSKIRIVLDPWTQIKRLQTHAKFTSQSSRPLIIIRCGPINRPFGGGFSPTSPLPYALITNRMSPIDDVRTVGLLSASQHKVCKLTASAPHRCLNSDSLFVLLGSSQLHFVADICQPAAVSFVFHSMPA